MSRTLLDRSSVHPPGAPYNVWGGPICGRRRRLGRTRKGSEAVHASGETLESNGMSRRGEMVESDGMLGSGETLGSGEMVEVDWRSLLGRDDRRAGAGRGRIG